MRTELFDYELPERLIATRPPAERDGGRLLVLGAEGLEHSSVRTLPERLREGDLLVLNETRVRRARLECRRPGRLGRGGEAQGGARVELLFLHPLGERRWSALGKANRPLAVGDALLGAGLEFVVRERGEGGTLVIEASGELEQALAEHGQMPIPPYMQRPSDDEDVGRYQTVFAERLGSAAAPTAGLHLTDELLARIGARGVELGRLTLHVGIGTFRPVTADDLDRHDMHSEWLEVSPELIERVAATRSRGGRVVAIGTTVVRALESAADEAGRLRAGGRDTRLLIQPGYRFRVVDALLTNFHQPKSTLLALVSAFVGRERLLAAYREAVAKEYRFLSYGDAMWLPGRLG